jgi:hypothetical protein
MGDHVSDVDNEDPRDLRAQMSHEGTPNPMPIVPLMVSWPTWPASQMSHEGTPPHDHRTPHDKLT